MAKSKADDLLKKLEALKKENSELKDLLKSEKKRAKKTDKSEVAQKDVLLQLNEFSLQLAYLPSNKLFPFITSQIKSIFNVRAALLNTYDERTSELVLQYTTLSDKENAHLIKVLGGKLLKRRTYVDKKDYKRITSKVYEQIPSLNELTFGAVPDLIGKTIEKIFGADWFAALGLVHNKKLVGTMILAGDKKQQFPEKETILAFAGITANALARKKAEDELSETEKRYANIVNSSPYGMHMYELREDEKLVIIGANPAADRILGFDHNSIIGLPIEKAFPSLIDTEVPKKYMEVIKNNAVWNTEQINYKDEKVIGAFEVFAFRISENQMVARFLEVTERIKKEQALKQSQENLAITLKSIGDGVIATDILGLVTNMNPVAEEMCGWKLDDAKGETLDKVFVIVDASTKNKLRNPVENVISTGKVVELSNHTVLISKDGTERNISDSAAPIIDKDNNIQGVVLVFSDVTEKYKTREEIKAREKRAVKHRKALTELATNKAIASGNISKAKKLLTEIAAEALEVERCSLWLMSDNNTEMKCIDIYEASLNKHSEGTIITYEQCPTYFKEVTENSPLSISDVIKDLRVGELVESYLLPLGIVSMLDSKVPSDDGGFGGVVCFEHKGELREWHPEEEAFATAIASYLVQIMSVASKKEADAALKEEKDRISAILNLVGDPIFVKDNQHRFTLCNKAFYEMVGLDEKNVLGKTLAEGIPAEEMEHFFKVDRMVLDTGVLDTREEVLTVNNKAKTILTSKTRYIDETGNKLLIGSIHDITERIKSEKELAHFNELMKFVISNTKSSVSVYDTEMNYIYVSDRYYDDFHLTDKNIIGRNHYDIFPDLPQFLKDIHKRALNGETISGEDDPLVHIDGSIDWSNWTCIPWYKSDSSIGGIIIYIEVITERKKAEEKISLLAQIVNIAPGGIFVHDFEGQIIYANQRAAQMHGCSSEEFLTLSLRDIDLPETADLIQTRMRDLDLYGEINFEGVHRRKDGSTYPVQSYTKRIEWAGKPAILSITTDITERKIAEETLRKSEERFSQAIAGTGAGLWDWDIINDKVYFSQQWKNMLGYEDHEIENNISGWKKLWHPDDAEMIEKAIDDYLQMNTPVYEVIHRLKHKDGSWHWILSRGDIHKDSSGIPVRWIGTNLDITKRQHMEERLAENERLYRNLIETTSAVAWEVDVASLRFSYISPQIYKMSGYSPDKWTDFDFWANCIHPEDRTEAINFCQVETARGEDHTFEYRLVSADGKIIWIKDVVSVSSVDGKAATLRGYFIDITVQKLAEIALRESESQFRSLFDNAADAIFIADAESGIIVNANQTAEKMLSTSLDNIIGKHQSELHPQEIKNLSQHIFQKHKKDVEELRIANLVESIVISSEGNQIPVEVIASKVLYQGKNCVMGIFRDITERKRVQEAFQKINRQFKMVWDKSTDGMRLTTEDGIVVAVNDSYCKMVGKEERELVGDFLSVMYGDEKKEQIISKYIENFHSRTFTPITERETILWNGKKVWFDISISLLEFDGKSPLLLGVFRDITERKKAEQALRESEEQYRTLVENLNEAVMLVDNDDRILFVNNKFTELLGYSTSEIIGKIGYEILLPKEEQKLMIEANADRISGKSGQYEVTLVNKNGDLRNFLINGSPVYNAEGNVIGSLGALTDITERKIAEEELERTKIQLIETIKQSPLPMVLASAEDFKIKIINKATEDFLLIDAKNYLEKSLEEVDVVWQEFTPEGEVVLPMELPLPHALQGMFTHNKEMRLERRDGSSVWQLASGAPIFNSKGKLIAGLLVMQDITKLKNAVKELRIREQRFEQLLQNSFDTIILFDANGIHRYVSASAERMHGFIQAELIDINVIEMLHPDDKEQFLEAFKNIIETGQGGAQYRHKRKGGGWVYLEARGINQLDNPDIGGVVVNVRDITKQKLAEEKQIELNRKLATLIGNLSGIAYRCKNDKNWTMEFISEGCQIVTGYNPQDFIDNKVISFNDIIHHKYQSYLWDEWQKCLSERRPMVAEYQIITKDDGIKWVWEQGCGIYDNKGELIALEGYITDISERKRAEKVQEILYNIASQIHLEKSTKDLLEFVRQEIGNVMDTTNFFAASYNHQKDTLKEIIYVDEKDNFESDEWSASHSISGHVVKEGKSVFLRGDEINEFYRNHNLGIEGTIPKSWIGVPIFSNAIAIGIMVIQNYENPSAFSNSDVTMLEMIAHEIGVFIEKHTMIEELVKAKNKAEEMNKVKSHFFANMSHELRTPFVGIMGYAELLAETLEKEDERLMADGILKASTRMQDTLANILSLSKLESESIEIKIANVEIKELITSLFESFKGGALRKKLFFEKEIKFNDLVIETDEVILKDILQNFVSNAIKYTNDGYVKLTAEIEKKEVINSLVIKVTDTGLGIPKDKLELIWEPFRQASEGLNRSFEGTGLGLSIVKKSTVLLGGDVKVESEYGKGSTFTFSLPINKGL